jgi:ribonucleotide reductase alpha subunit
MTKAGLQVLSGGYFGLGETTAQEVFARVCTELADDAGHAQRLYDYMSQHWFMAATPILANIGCSKNLGISCFLNVVGDSRKDLADHWAENLWLSTMGGGVGTDYSAIRSEGEMTSSGNMTTGLIPFMKVDDSLQLAAKQGKVRRAAFAAYLDISHPEIEEFLIMRKPSGGSIDRKCLNLHHAVNIPDSFMEAVKEDGTWDLVDPNSKQVKKTMKARELWFKILETRTQTGEPYLHFTDTTNRAVKQPLKDKGLKVTQSNLCVAPETLLFTKKGYKTISTLKDKTLDVWNGAEWSEVTVRQTSESSELIRVHLNTGTTLDCTPYHKFYISTDYHKPLEVIEAKDLLPGMKIEKAESFPQDFVYGTEELPHPYAHGFWSGDGNADYEHSWVYEPKKDVIPHLDLGTVGDFDSYGRARWNHGPMSLTKNETPSKYSLNSRLKWLAGLLDADACVVQSTHSQNIQLTSVNHGLLQNIVLMLQEMGVTSSLFTRRAEGKYLLPLNNGTGENGLFSCKEVWMLNINSFGVKRLLDLGIEFRRLNVQPNQHPNRDASRFVKVDRVEVTGRVDKTFCATEPKRHKLMFNGVVTGNCCEILLPTNTERTAVCCLSSVNLEKFSEWEKHPTFVEDICRFLDNNLSHFLRNAPDYLSKAKFSARMGRDIGLGAMGFHSYLQGNGTPFESVTAAYQNTKIFSHLRTEIDKASLKLGSERGEAPDMEGTGHRFSHTQAIAPNASISNICGECSPSVEPYTSNGFRQDTKSGSLLIKNKHLDHLLKTKYKDQNYDATWTSIITNVGSVQHLEWMDSWDKDVFKTAYELDQNWIVKHASDRQKTIDQGQSINLFFYADCDKNHLNKVHFNAWKEGLKTLYYCRSTAMSRPEYIGQISTERKPEDSACLACEG